MEALIYIDTHVLLWIYDGRLKSLSPLAMSTLEENQIAISPMVHLELQFLREVKKITATPAQYIDYLKSAIELEVVSEDMQSVVHIAGGLKWTRDPFDRIITAQASLKSTPLVTRDKTILKNYAQAVW